MFLFGEQRAPREPRSADFAPVLQPSALQRFMAELNEGYPFWSAVLELLAGVIEIVAVVIYFIAVELPPEGFDVSTYAIHHFPYRPEFIWVLGLLGIFWMLQFCFMFAATDSRANLILSMDFVLFLVTAPAMVTTLIMKKSNQSITVNAGTQTHVTTSIWCPAFLRVWWAQRFVLRIIAVYANLSCAVKEIIAQCFFLLCITVTAAALFQVVQTLYIQHIPSFDEMLYFVMVTTSTMGYGDIRPDNRFGRNGFVVVIVLIFVAMMYLPIVINTFTELALYLRRHNSYRRSHPHVIIYGTFTEPEVNLLLREFTAGNRKFFPLNLVMVSPTPFDPAVPLLISKEKLSDRVTLCVCTSNLRDEIERFGTRRADAVFLLSSRSAVAQRGDFEVLLKSVSFRRHDRNLPQYLMLKRGMHATAAKQQAFVVFERESIKYTMMGMALQLRGFIPFFMNLIKTSDSKEIVDLDGGWWYQYEDGMSSSLFTMLLPLALEGREFVNIANILMMRCSITAIGVVKRDKTTIEIVPFKYKFVSGDKVVVIARGARATQMCAELFSKEEAAGKVTQRPSKRVPPTAPYGLASEGSRIAKAYHKPIGNRKKANLFPFKDHVLLIDLSCLQGEEEMSPEEKIEKMQFQTNDLIFLLRRFFSNKNENIVLLSSQDLGEPFCEAWPKYMKPIYHVRGAGADPAWLDQCNVGEAKAVLIFTSMEGVSPSGDAPVVLVQRMVVERLRAANREREVPVVIELDDYGKLSSCDPRLSANVPPEVAAETDRFYFLSPVFAVGGAICSAMLDTAIYQTYYNEYLPQIIQKLLYDPLHSHKIEEIVVSDILPGIFASPLGYSYADIFQALLNSNNVAFGIFKVIETPERGESLIGYRFFYTNPLPDTILRANDIVYYISWNSPEAR